MSKKLSLAELMGTTAADAGGKLSLKQLPEILGDAMPDLPRNAVGRHRLIRSLQNRFGSNFRSLPGLKDLIKEFDDEAAFEVKLARMKAIRYNRSKE